MKKAGELRAHLQKWVPELKKDPKQLTATIPKGSISCRLGASLSYEYSYELQLLVTDYTRSADTLMVPLLVWIEQNQPDLLQDEKKREQAISFEAEVIDDERTDILIKLNLTERVLVSSSPQGFDCRHLGEPALPDFSGPTSWALYLNGDLLAPDPITG